MTRSEPVPQEVERLLATVPEWFGRPESNAEYVRDAERLDNWIARRDDGSVAGIALVARHYAETAEIHLIVVDRSEHGRGAGTVLVSVIEEWARGHGVQLLEVKTLGPSDPNPEYARTRRFYEHHGFLPLEETDLWGEDSPCLIMVKVVQR